MLEVGEPPVPPLGVTYRPNCFFPPTPTAHRPFCDCQALPPNRFPPALPLRPLFQSDDESGILTTRQVCSPPGRSGSGFCFDFNLNFCPHYDVRSDKRIVLCCCVLWSLVVVVVVVVVAGCGGGGGSGVFLE